ncbi:MAG: hypothetical protein FWE30_04470 [Bacteroidales bacterium]|nr:hypothetical protein [Bacteroidales bacterium]
MKIINKYLLIAMAVLLVAALTSIKYQNTIIKVTKADRNTYKQNMEVLIGEVEHYVTKDSLSAAKTQVLELKLEEYEQFRAEDLATIGSLRVRLRNLDNVVTTQLQTMATIRGTFRDSIINDFLATLGGNVEKVQDTIKRLDIRTTWWDFEAELRTDTYELNGLFTSRDSLFITAQTEYKRFKLFGLIPLWETNNVLKRDVDAVSKNPYTQIMGLEFIEIRKKRR